MLRQTKQYAVVIAGKDDYFGEIDTSSRMVNHDIARLCEEAVRKHGFTSPRKTPTPVACEVFALEIKAGKLERRRVGLKSIMPPLEQMTSDEYHQELSEILESLPVEFRSYVSGAAWDSGHSAGHVEVIGIARGMALNLRPCIEQYTKRLKYQTQKEIKWKSKNSSSVL
jgi:hypothetical protein